MTGYIARAILFVVWGSFGLAACSYDSPATDPDAAALPTVGFATPTTLVDELSGTVAIPVQLSQAGNASVNYRVTGGNAIRPDDYILDDGTLTFAGTETENIEVTINNDILEEPDETIELELTSPMGATLGQATHTITISSDILPRVSIVGGTVSEAEDVSGDLTLQLDLAPTTEVSVNLAISGTASTDDTGLVDQTVTFAAGQTTATVPLSIVDDALDEDDETIDIDLTLPVGLVIDTTASHATHTILDNDDPPSIGFVSASGTNKESAANANQTVQLSGPSGKIITVQYAQSAGDANDPADFMVGGAGMLTFMPGQTTQTIPLTVKQDTLDEANETATISLSNATNATLTTADFVLTIEDDDDPPKIGFKTATSTATEGTTTTATITVDLSTASGLPITVDFGAGAGTTVTRPGDLTIDTTSPLSFAPGDTSKDITLTITNDNIGELDELLVLVLSNASNATLDTTADTHTLTVKDDDCRGTGNFRVCPPVAPAGNVTLSGSFDTGTDGRCQSTQPVGWTTTQGEPAACFVIADTITVDNALTVTGTRPLVLMAGTAITVSSDVDASGDGTTGSGPGAPFGSCGAFGGNQQSANSDGDGGGGGAGGSFMTQGGDAGDGNGNRNGGNAPAADATDPTILRGGCVGQDGANGRGGGGGANGGGGGGAGGAIYLLAPSVTVSGTIDVSGGGGRGGQANGKGGAGGGGAGTGGMILIDSAAVDIGGVLIANGGGAGQGADGNTNGGTGSDASAGNPTTPASGGNVGSAGGDGGNGFAGVTAATNGGTGNNNNEGGGGGGGGGGYIKGVGTPTGTVSAGKVVP